MKLLNISNIKSTPNKSVIEEYDEEDEYEDYNIYSNKCAIFIAKSETEILENIKKIYLKIFPPIKVPIVFENRTGALRFDILNNCPNCEASELKKDSIQSRGTETFTCQHCKSNVKITNPDDTITIHRYIKEQLLIVELYDEYMNPRPDNIMLIKYLNENTLE